MHIVRMIKATESSLPAIEISAAKNKLNVRRKDAMILETLVIKDPKICV